MPEPAIDDARNAGPARPRSVDPLPGRMLHLAGRIIRAGLLAVALAIVAWAFYWVMMRPLRRAEAVGERIEIVMLHWGDRDEDAIVQSLVESFERANPGIRIKRINAGASYVAKLQTMIASGDPPDIFFLNAYHLPIYAPRGILLDVEPFLERDAAAGRLGFEMDDLIDEAISGFRFDGEQLGAGPLYGLPMSFTPMGFYYNMDLFARAGVAPPAPGWTWDDFERIARLVTERTGVRGGAVDLRGAQLLRLMLWAEGTDLTTDGFARVRTEDPRVLAALEQLRSWRDDQETFRIFGDAREELETSSSVFMAGRAAMQGPVGRWLVPPYRQIEDFDWAWAPMPRGSQQQNMLYIAAWCIAAKTEHPEEAWAVARHFATPEGQRINSSLGLALPTLWSVARSEAFLSPDLAPADDQVFLDAVAGSRPMTWPRETKITRAMRDAVDSVVRLGNAAPEQALVSLQRDIDREMSSELARGEFPRVEWREVALWIGIGVGGVVVGGLVAGRLSTKHRGRGSGKRRRVAGSASNVDEGHLSNGVLGGTGGLGRRRERAGLAMASPWIIGLGLFIAAPMLLSLLLAFMRWSGLATIDQAEWVGLANFREMLGHDDRFRRAAWITFVYALISVPAGQVVALGAAMLLTNPVRFVNTFRAMWYLPTVLAGVAMAILWWSVFDSESGLMNSALAPILSPLKLEPPEWFGSDARWAGVLAYAIASLWTFGGAMLIYLAGLHAIPKHLYEAAEIDGAGPLRRLRTVTLPMLSPVILFNMIIAIIASFQVFTQAYIMTKGGPGDATLFFVLYLYEEAFEHHEMGYASALAWALFVVVFALTLVVLRISRRRVHYEGVAL